MHGSYRWIYFSLRIRASARRRATVWGMGCLASCRSCTCDSVLVCSMLVFRLCIEREKGGDERVR